MDPLCHWRTRTLLTVNPLSPKPKPKPPAVDALLGSASKRAPHRRRYRFGYYRFIKVAKNRPHQSLPQCWWGGGYVGGDSSSGIKFSKRILVRGILHSPNPIVIALLSRPEDYTKISLGPVANIVTWWRGMRSAAAAPPPDKVMAEEEHHQQRRNRLPSRAYHSRLLLTQLNSKRLGVSSE